MCVQAKCFSSLGRFLSLYWSVYFVSVTFQSRRNRVWSSLRHHLLLAPTLLTGWLFTFVILYWLSAFSAIIYYAGLLLLEKLLHVDSLGVHDVILTNLGTAAPWLVKSRSSLCLYIPFGKLFGCRCLGAAQKICGNVLQRPVFGPLTWGMRSCCHRNIAVAEWRLERAIFDHLAWRSELRGTTLLDYRDESIEIQVVVKALRIWLGPFLACSWLQKLRRRDHRRVLLLC